jgi:hypothetical protein
MRVLTLKIRSLKRGSSGLIPQAPLHTASLVVMGRKGTKDDEEAYAMDSPTSIETRQTGGALVNRTPRQKRRVSEVKREIEKLESQINIKEGPVAVVEQRVSNLVQGAFCEWMMY